MEQPSMPNIRLLGERTVRLSSRFTAAENCVFTAAKLRRSTRGRVSS